MDIRRKLQQLPAPDPHAPDRIWQRFEEERSGPAARTLSWPAFGVGSLALALAALAVVVIPEQIEREVGMHAAELTNLEWSDTLHLTFSGHGSATGSGRDIRVDWESGTVKAEVAPGSGTNLEIITEEAEIRVVGTVFDVRRDRMGVTTTVERGTVHVACGDGWEGEVHAAESHTCLPLRPALLMGRADALADQGASVQTQLETLDMGLSRADAGTAEYGGLLVRRMQLHADQGRSDAALADARRYLDAAQPSRRTDVLRRASYLVLAESGCAEAMTWLEPLVQAGTPEDGVLLAECVLADDPQRARDLLEAARDVELEPMWQARVSAALDRLGADR